MFAVGTLIAERPPHRSGFQTFVTARCTLAGAEAMAMLSKGQGRAVPKNDMPAQRAFVDEYF